MNSATYRPARTKPRRWAAVCGNTRSAQLQARAFRSCSRTASSAASCSRKRTGITVTSTSRRTQSTAQQKLGALLNASKTDLSEFNRRGGKLIQYHGLLDGSIPPAMSTTYYDGVAKQSGGVGKTQDFYRLFLAPGVLHCGFGPGPNAFGNMGPRPPAERGARHVARSFRSGWRRASRRSRSWRPSTSTTIRRKASR